MILCPHFLHKSFISQSKSSKICGEKTAYVMFPKDKTYKQNHFLEKLRVSDHFPLSIFPQIAHISLDWHYQHLSLKISVTNKAKISIDENINLQLTHNSWPLQPSDGS